MRREVVFIAMSRKIGFSLTAIAQRLPSYRAGRLRNADMLEALELRVAEMDQELAALAALRAPLHLPFAERELRRAAPEIEAIYIAGLEAEGALAWSFGPRERERTLARGRGD